MYNFLFGRIIALIEEVRMSTTGGTTHDTDARGVNMVPEAESHKIHDPSKEEHS